MSNINPNKYSDLLPMYLKKGQKINAWLQFLGTLLYNYDSTMEGVFDILTFNSNISFNISGNFVGPKANGYKKGLDIVSNWFGIYRQFKIEVPKESGGFQPKVLELSDREMFRLIRTELWKIGFDGTGESLQSNLNGAFDLSPGSKDLQIFVYKDTDPASAVILVRFVLGTFTSNDFDLWTSGYYNNPVIGIKYRYRAIPDNQLIYDFDLPYDGRWDDGVVLPTIEPNSPSVGDMWFDPDTDKLYTCVAGGDWEGVEGEIIPTIADPSSARYFDESTNTLYTWTTRYYSYDSVIELSE